MQQFQSLLLKVWQESCRHIEIDQSCANISKHLLEYLPLRQVMVRTMDHSRRLIETVALGMQAANSTLPEAASHFTDDQWQDFILQCISQPIWHKSRDTEAACIFKWLPFLIDYPDVLIGRLGDKNEVRGILILIASDSQVFTSQHLDVMSALLEPFTVALENDARLREMATLRKAAEEDRASLLQKLYRKEPGDTIVGAMSGLRMVMERVQLVARSDVPVLILGETGTGKELISREIHRRSLRADGPFIRVNCGAIPPELIDSQLFGHEKGAFTGAMAVHQGWFERANGGTLFLDEIGELAPAGQVRLLRVLQDGWLERVGGKQPIHVDVRTVVATHQDLAGRVRTGLFREDLWYRLNVFPILLPSLHDRLEDIPSLARHFAERAALRFFLPPQLPTADDLRILTSYSWPGNIRELASVIDRAAILGNGQGLQIRKALGVLDQAVKIDPAIFSNTEQDELLSLDQVVRQHIEKALKKCGGQVEGAHGAANILNIHPNTLRARMRKLGISWAAFRK